MKTAAGAKCVSPSGTGSTGATPSTRRWTTTNPMPSETPANTPTDGDKRRPARSSSATPENSIATRLTGYSSRRQNAWR